MQTIVKRVLAVAASAGAALAPALVPGGASAAGLPASVYVSPAGAPGAADTSCKSAAYSVINEAIGAVAEGGTVVVCNGTYEESVSVGKTLTLSGRTGAVIDASGQTAGADVTADGVTVRGLTVENATEVGIRVSGSNAIIASNTADNNGLVPSGVTGGIYLQGSGSRAEGNTMTDNGGGITLFDCPDCQVADNTVTNDRSPAGGLVVVRSKAAVVEHNVVTGSEGGGIFILASSDMHISRNRASNNRTGYGIYLSDGPGYTRGNVVSDNITDGNGAAGIALTTGSDGGVNDNIIQNNTVKDNNGEGIRLNDSPSGSSEHGNMIAGNWITGNGAPGVTVEHGNATDMSGNVITGNRIGANNLLGTDFPFISVNLTERTGIAVASTSLLSIEIYANTIHSDYYGIWKNDLVTASGANHFGNVTVPVFTAP